MKAILREDLIIKLSLTEGIEVGNIPNNVSLDRLRWDGSRIIDLANISIIYVRYLGDNFFELHAIPLSGTQWLPMSYKQRKDLRFNNVTGQIYLASEDIKADEAVKTEIEVIKRRLGIALDIDNDLFLKHFAFTAALIVYASEQPQALKNFFDEITPHIKEAFPLNRWEVILRGFAKDIKMYLENLYEAMDKGDGT